MMASLCCFWAASFKAFTVAHKAWFWIRVWERPLPRKRYHLCRATCKGVPSLEWYWPRFPVCYWHETSGISLYDFGFPNCFTLVLDHYNLSELIHYGCHFTYLPLGGWNPVYLPSICLLGQGWARFRVLQERCAHGNFYGRFAIGREWRRRF
jgi:hypothetical protein